MDLASRTENGVHANIHDAYATPVSHIQFLLLALRMKLKENISMYVCINVPIYR